ncbi:hypothetical protein LZ31DRAFT_366901 [Colletotrichum somersetense]|nr:hypothetical protein LZ31DRAFT_366901 [Colletotrichum somersetense]
MAAALPQEPVYLLQRIRELATPTPPSSYPPVSSIPRTSPSRLAAASTDHDDDAAQDTVLYLAYGSNLSAETFLGARGIRPISQVNVSAPALTLVFDLPGLPYREPCFANTAPRKVPKLPDPSDPPKFPPIPPPPPGLTPPQPWASSIAGGGSDDKTRTPDLGWDKGLFGVVYEVTREDYATIVATEGGGSSYADILTLCIPLPPRISVPEKPPIDIPRPFLAHTLYSPAIPDPDDDDNDDDDEDDNHKDGNKNGGDPGRKKPDDPRKKWYWRFLRPARRPDPTYAQPSARYLKLITDGAAEHELPDDYQRWLRSLRPYAATTSRQRVARALLTAFFWYPLLLVFALSKALAGRDGRAPLFIGVALGAIFNLLWMAYDGVLKPVFGDGERTQDEDGGADGDAASRRTGGTRSWRGWRRAGTDEEKMGLLDNMD